MRSAVYIQEVPLPRLVQGTGEADSYGAFIGTSVAGPTTVQLITSWSQFQSAYGGFSNTRSSLAPALFEFFVNGGTGAYVRRVIPADATAASVALPSVDNPDTPVIAVDAISPGAWGNSLAVDILLNETPANPGVPTSFDLVVRSLYRGVSVISERFPAVTLNPDDIRYLEKIVNSTTIGSALVQAQDLNNGLQPALLPEAVSMAPLSAGSDGTQAVTPSDHADAVDDFESIESNLLFNVPGESAVDAVVAKVEARGDSFVVIDPPPDLTADAVVGTSFPVSSYCAVYFPWLGIPDPNPDSPRGSLALVPPGGAVVGMIMRTDASRGPFKAPAGIGAVMSGAVTTARRLSNADLDNLNDMNINAIRPVPGAGIVAMGGRSRDFITTARYISVRRTLNYIKATARNVSQFALFEPNTPSLWEQLRVANGAFLSEFWQLGGLAGGTFTEAFYVKCDSDNNTPATIANGEVHVEIGVAPVFPAEFVIIRLGQFEADASTIVTEEI